MTTPSGLWVEGDTLSPTNLNRRNPVGTFPAKIYHVAWAAGTGTTQITNAIANAAAGGYTAVFIDASRLPYDASTVTFNNAVHMLREGGSLSLDEYDVMAYGADNTSVSDTYYAVQAALDAAANASTTNGSQTVRFPPGFYTHSRPFWVKGCIRIVGSRQRFNNDRAAPSRLNATYFSGPSIAVQSASAVVQGLTTALVTGNGQAYLANTNNYFLELRGQNPDLDVHGLSQFCIEAFYKGTGHGILVRSEGRFLQSDTLTSAFSLSSHTGAITFSLNLSTSGLVSISGGDIVSDNVLHDICGDYDGSTMRLFVDGVLKASSAASGTIVQGTAEDVTVGVSINRAPQQTLNFGHPNGTLDSIRISNTSRHAVNYTASYAKRTSDGTVLALLNFDDQIGAFTKMSTKDGTTWAWENGGTAAVYGCPGFEIDGMNWAFNQVTAIHLARAGQFEWTARHLDIRGCRNGIIAFDGYDNLISRIYINAASTFGRYGIVLGATGGISSIEHGWIQGYRVHIAICGGGTVLTRLFFQEDTHTHAALIVRPESSAGNLSKVASCLFNTEPGVTATVYRANALIGGAPAVPAQGAIFESCTFEGGNGTSTPWIVADSVNGSIFNGCSFKKTGATPTSVVSAMGTFVQPIMFNQCTQLEAWVPWSNVSGTATVGRIGTHFSSSTGSTVLFDASGADVWDLTLTSDVTQSSWSKINYGQPVSGAIKMDSTGSRLFVWPTNSKGTATLSYGSAAVNTFTGFYDGVNVILTSVRTGL